MTTVNRLKLNKYVVNKIAYTIDTKFDFKSKKAINICPQFKRVVKNINNNTFSLKISVKISDELQENEVPFSAEVVITGLFNLTDWKNTSNRNFGIDVGTTVLYPYLRSLLSNTVNNGNLPPYVLPITNTKMLFENIETKKVLKT